MVYKAFYCVNSEITINYHFIKDVKIYQWDEIILTTIIYKIQ